MVGLSRFFVLIAYIVQPAHPTSSISAYTATSAVGIGKGALIDALTTRRSGLRRNDSAARR